MEVVIFGAGGFIGGAVTAEIARRGWTVRPISAPRLRVDAGDLDELTLAVSSRRDVRDALSRSIGGADVVVNAAGLPTPAGVDASSLTGANAMLPLILAEACGVAGVPRLVHISSAAVQGARSPLDETLTFETGSAYGRAKALGEAGVVAASGTRPPGSVVILRPTSVHGPQRALTRGLARLARSPLATVMGPGDSPTPQVLVENVASAVAYLCSLALHPPFVVLQPWEGWTTSSFLHLMGRREPMRVPGPIGRPILRVAQSLGRNGSAYAYRRRLELLWTGQPQVSGWLKERGFVPPAGPDSWRHLASQLAGQLGV